MRYRLLGTRLLAVVCLFGAHHAWADTMRCGAKVIQAGESMLTVRAVCGPPAMVQQGVKEDASTAVPAETWTYDRGPNMFLVNIRFVDGKVVSITTLHEYGH